MSGFTRRNLLKTILGTGAVVSVASLGGNTASANTENTVYSPIVVGGWTYEFDCSQCGDRIRLSGDDVNARTCGWLADLDIGVTMARWGVGSWNHVIYNVSCPSCGKSEELMDDELPIKVMEAAKKRAGMIEGQLVDIRTWK